MNILLFVFANLAVFISAIGFSSRLKLNSLSDRIISVFVLAVTQIIITELLLGVVVKRLYGLELLLVNILIAAFSIILNRKAVTGSKILCSIMRCKILFVELIKSPLVASVSFIALVQIVYIIIIGLNFPPYGWDELWYHLTATASWYQEGKIFMLPMPSIWSDPQFISTLDSAKMAYHMSVAGFWYNVYPMNTELLSLWNIIFLKNDTIVDLTQFPFAMAGVLAIYSLARKVGLKERYSAAAGLLFLMTPIVIIQSRTSYVDIAFGTLTIIAINFTIGFIKYKQYSYAAMAAVAGGLVLGTKSSGIAFAGIFIFCLLITEYLNNKKNIKMRRLLKNAFFYTGLVLLIGGFWYIRNLYYYGNPIYPYMVKIGNYTILNGLDTVNNLIMNHNTPPEYVNSSNAKNILKSWLELDSFYSVDIRKAGFGPLWIILEVPAIIVFTLIAAKRRMKVALMTIMIFIILFAIHPSNWWTRYTIFIIGLGCIALGYIMQFFSKPTRFAVAILTVVFCIYTTVLTIPHIINININKALEIPFDKRTIGSTYYSDYVWADQIPKDSRVGTAPMTFIYPLFSHNFKNKVYIIDASTDDEWVQKILQSNVDYITFQKGYLHYEEWIKSYPQYFNSFFEGQALKVYNVNNKVRGL